MKIHGSIVFASALALVSGTASAEYPMTFETLDNDGNGYISKSEATTREDLTENWQRIDQNTDDQLDISEFSAFESEGRFTPPEETEEEDVGEDDRHDEQKEHGGLPHTANPLALHACISPLSPVDPSSRCLSLQQPASQNGLAEGEKDEVVWP